MIILGGMMVTGLTSVVALIIFHLRSRLLKTALSIYNQDKVERQFADEECNPCGKDLDLTIGSLPRTVTRVNPMYNGSSDVDSAIFRFDDKPAEHANGTVTIGIRLSSNLRDLLESQYDRPASCSQRSAAAPGAAEAELEHVYDEIPSPTPFRF